MPDLPTLLLLALGVLLLVLMVLRLYRALRGLTAVRGRFANRLEDGLGTLRARIAALTEALAERRQARSTNSTGSAGHSDARVRTGAPGSIEDRL